MTIPDQPERQRAVMTDGHAFVWASAGTGKTHTLTLRALYLLLTAPFHPTAKGTDRARLYTPTNRAERLRAARAVIRRLVLTTFTRKAAAEMQTRLYEYLDALANAKSLAGLRARFVEKDPQFIELAENVLENLRGADDPFRRLTAGAQALGELATELQVGTLHSYAAAILRRHPVAAGIPPTAQFAEEDDRTAADPAETLVDRWWQHVGGDAALSGQLAELVPVVPLADLRRWLVAIVQEPWIAREMAFDPPDPGVLAEIRAATGQLVAGLGGARANWRSIIQAREALRGALQRLERGEPNAWTELAVALQEHEAAIFDADSKFVGKAVAGLGPLAKYYQDYQAVHGPVLAHCLATEQAARWQTWQRLTIAFAAWAEGAAVRELGLVTFDDMMRRAVNVLAANEAVRREERERLGALLVDEFQDTDPVQLELLRHLVRRDSPRDHEVLGFFVGDLKQSIYRFRKADLAAIRHFFGAYAAQVRADRDRVREFRLTASFRSLRPITDFVNHLFATVLPLPRYEPDKLDPVRPERGECPEWRLLAAEPTGKSADAKREMAAWETARLIEDYLRPENGADHAYQDVVVLVNTHDELDALLPVLEQAGVPAVSSGAKTFYERPEVLDALNLLVALHNPQDSLAVGALLRSPLFGLSDVEIFRLLRAVRTCDLFGNDGPLPAGLAGPVAARLQTMRQLFRDRARQTATEWLRRVREFIPVSVYARQDAEGRAVVRIDQVFAAFGRVRGLSLVPPLAWLLEQRARADRSDAFDADLGEDISVTDESVAAVRVMTIHKAKGLQGRFVIVYGWQQVLKQRHERAQRQPFITVTNDDGATVAGFRLPWGPLEIVSRRYTAAEQIDRREAAAEGVRLAYVAATRAKDRLVLLSHDPAEIEDGILTAGAASLPAGAPPRAVFDETLRVRLVNPSQGTARPHRDKLAVADAAAYVRLWQARAAAGVRPPAPLLHRPSQPEHHGEEDEVEPTDYAGGASAPARAMARDAGTLVHRYLERHLTDAAFTPGKLRELAGPTRPGGAGAAASAKARFALQVFYGSPLHHRTRAGRILGRELPLYLAHEGKAWNGVMDLVLEETGTVIGVDYKLMAAPAVLPEAYDQQQRIYREALARLFPARNISFEFWWLGEG